MAKRVPSSPSPLRGRRTAEKDIRTWIRSTWRLPIHFIEYALGGDTGLSDSQLTQQRRMTPCELKYAELNKTFFVFDLRKAQYDYHVECLTYGVGTIFVIGIGSAIMGAVGSDVVKYRKGKQCFSPFSIWRELNGHDDISELIDDAWREATRPRIVVNNEEDGAA